jgi:hypothetical protein
VIRFAPNPCILAFLLGSAGLGIAARPQAQRIPRQTQTATAAVQGIVQTQQGLGLGGVAVILQSLSSGKTFPIATTGDGAFRFLDLLPGRYQVTASRDGFEPFSRGDIDLKPGDVFPLEIALRAPPPSAPGLRELPRQP